MNQSDQKQKKIAKEKQKCIDQSNVEFVCGLKDAVVTVPDQIVDFNLEKAGCNCPDLRVRRLIGIAAKKLIFDVCRGAMDHREHHIQGLPATKQKAFKNKKQTMEMDHLLMALRDKGICLNKPPFYVAE